ncbi:MAG: hypothetical protein ACRBBW_21350 [Cellvibrionaceae bacterium]
MGSKSKKKTSTTNTNQTAYDTRNSALSGDVENGSIGVAGSKNNLANYNYEDADFSTELNYDYEYDYDNSKEVGDVEDGSIALGGANTGTINMTNGRAFDVVESIALAAVDGIRDTSKEALNETVEGLTYLNAGVAKNDEQISAVKTVAYVAGAVAAAAFVAKAVGGKAA